MKRFPSILFITCLLIICNGMAVGQKDDAKQRPFDAYGAISEDDASARLDNFVVALQSLPDLIGFIISYGPGGKTSGSGNFALQVTRDYLVNTRGIDPSRVQTIYAGRYKDPMEVFTELWIVPVGMVPPERRRYNAELKKISGKFIETAGWDGPVDGCGCGPSFGNRTLAGFADLLRGQPNDVGYIVAFNLRGAVPGTWRRVAKLEIADLIDGGVEADRLKIIYGGTVAAKEEDPAHEVRLQYWILPVDAPPPVKEAKPEKTPKEAMQIGAYGQYELKDPKEERRIFDGFADVLRADKHLSAYLIVRAEIPSGEKNSTPDESPDIDQAKLVDKWKADLKEKFGIQESRIVIIQAGADESRGGTVEVWVVPPGASLPDPNGPAEDNPDEDDMADTSPQSFVR